MLTDQDIQKIIDANKAVFVTKEELQSFQEEMRKDFSTLVSSIDGYSKKADMYFQEMLMLAHKVDRHERWLSQIAQKLDIKLEY